MSLPRQRIAFHTLGCKLNFAETATILRDFDRERFEQVDFRAVADVYVINTCSVTENADRTCRKLVRQVRRRAPEATIALIGCYAQLKPEEVGAIPGVDLVLGTAEKFDLADYLNNNQRDGSPVVHSRPMETLDTFTPAYSVAERTRAFLKVQDGCDYQCTFCTIPLARGHSRSAPIATVVEQARALVRNGAREIVLTGVNIGDFGRDHGETFLELLTALENQTTVDRIRFSSIEPNLLTEDLIRFIAQSEKFVPHFHIPLQSGSNRILRAMRRRYQRELYAQRVAMVRSRLPEVCIGVDVIVGFPGETETDFQETYAFLNELEVAYLHVFPYSEREHTPAADFPDKVSPAEKNRRGQMLRILSQKKRYLFQQQFIGREMPVLFETHRDGWLQGHTANYITVRVQGPETCVNEIVPVNLSRNRGEYMLGELLNVEL
jgi:threonylcarbamoyladenosine tRNA methylthiotransferase MtaB